MVTYIVKDVIETEYEIEVESVTDTFTLLRDAKILFGKVHRYQQIREKLEENDRVL